MKLLKRIKDGANKATEKAQGAVEIGKINGQIGEIEKEMEHYFQLMGKVFYEGYRTGDMSVAEVEMTEYSKACDSLKKEIDELRSRIAELRNERLCSCGQVVMQEARFCPYCGEKLTGAGSAPKRAEQPQKSQPKAPAQPIKSEPSVIFPQEIDDLDEVAVTKEAEASLEPVDAERTQLWLDEEEEEHFSEHSQWQDEELKQEQWHNDELERERERQLELDRRIRYWKENNHNEEYTGEEQSARGTFKCQICAADLALGSKWCPRCGAEQI